jgi:hypothetical protein
MLHSVPVMAHTCVEYVHVIACTLARNVSAAQVKLYQQELKYTETVSPEQIKMFLTAMGMGLALVEFVSAQRYEHYLFIHFFSVIKFSKGFHSHNITLSL